MFRVIECRFVFPTTPTDIKNAYSRFRFKHHERIPNKKADHFHDVIYLEQGCLYRSTIKLLLILFLVEANHGEIINQGEMNKLRLQCVEKSEIKYHRGLSKMEYYL